ncbi:MAG: 4'-phosphopantetheinyl transferase superfamily protein [Burkholderiales bacterium]|nr:4'-phosphopantetheinyl transferase superfamily protein [Burkholderiales bacterium]
MSINQAGGVHVWAAHPKDFDEAQWSGLAAWLDSFERFRACLFRLEADRRAYILAHALRRLALASALAVPPGELSFSSAASGKPLLTAPEDPGIYFSHARTRSRVVCAVTRIGPVGIDVESLDGDTAELDLLAGFVELPDALRREMERGGDAPRHFFIYWTLLEAYWKSRGCGLSFANPPIRCHKTGPGWFKVSPASGDASLACAWAISLTSPPGCVASLVLEGRRAGAAAGEINVIYHDPDFFRAAPPAGQPQQP